MANDKKNNSGEKKEPYTQEKRAVPRVKREVTVRYRIKELPQKEGVQVFFEPFEDATRTKDLSENGLFFTASRAIFPQTILDIRLQLPLQEEPVDLEGRVVSCEEMKKNFIYAVRVEFIDPKDEQKEILRKFIQLFLKG